MKNAPKVLYWVVMNGVVAALAWGGVAMGVQWEANVFRFLFWVNAAYTVFILLGSHEEEARRELAKGTGVSDWIDGAYDVALGALLAAHGWFGYAFGVVLVGLVKRAIYANAARQPMPVDESELAT